MPSRGLCAVRLPWPIEEPSLERFHAKFRGQPPRHQDRAESLRCDWGGPRGEDQSYPGFLELTIARFDLNQWIIGVHGLHRFIQHRQSIGIGVSGRQLSFYGLPYPTQTAEGVIYCGSFVAAVHHAVGAL